MPELRKVTVTEQDASGFGFGDFTFSAPGTYAYTVTEEQAGQTVDGLSHAAPARIIFSVMDNDLGGYSVGRTVTGIQQDTFVNAYRPTPIQVAAPAELRKELRAPAWDDGLTFSFNLTDVSTDADGAPLAPTLPQWEGTGSGTSALPAPPVCDVGGRRCTVGVGKPESGMVTPIDFGVFTFTGAGTYRYAITEIDESPLHEGIYYDAHAATLTITVTDDGDGTLSASVALKDSTFVNTAGVELPSTGGRREQGMLALALAVVFLVGAAACVIRMNRMTSPTYVRK